MKNSILAILAVAALASCKKNETTVVDNATDSSMIAPTTDSSMMPKDSTSMTSTTGTMGTMSAQDKMFADAAAKGGMMEVMMGELAETSGMNAKVKALGKMMKEDHTKANDELKSWAMTAKYMLPTKMDADQQKMYDDLKMKKGADFDKAYTDLMVTDHKKDIAEFKKEATEGTGDLKAFASKTVSTLEGHLKASEDAMKAVK
ncbi:DUF4142 domain-containing protein [Kaistella jeonii]|uniref:Membrane protein n=1 Tax=Kaistella jeonii TaxID=266749 RepID=A0A0C1D2Z9_9FLAO|nr:DUF4142 domain-containing protein [Kaistella jeonii]KIA88145.1 membrane protein [Kaistella jeonii]SFC29281.1 putative membrane protein [Kaistella jeonii]VEI96891.1 Predicted outer membrane protein [Kaistella jeonii]